MERNPLAESLATRASALAASHSDARVLSYLENIRSRVRKVADGGDCDRQVALECCATMG